jgi:hypothetical protein
MMTQQFIAVFFLMPEANGVALERMKGFAAHDGSRGLAPQYVMRPPVRCVLPAIKDKENI